METEGAFERRMVLPGDPIAAAEEYEAGEGTYEKDGQIFAAIPGLLELDGENFVARVRPFNPLAELKEGEVVFGVISALRSRMAEEAAAAVQGNMRGTRGGARGALRGSKTSTGDTRDSRRGF